MAAERDGPQGGRGGARAEPVGAPAGRHGGNRRGGPAAAAQEVVLAGCDGVAVLVAHSRALGLWGRLVGWMDRWIVCTYTTRSSSGGKPKKSKPKSQKSKPICWRHVCFLSSFFAPMVGYASTRRRRRVTAASLQFLDDGASASLHFTLPGICLAHLAAVGLGCIVSIHAAPALTDARASCRQCHRAMGDGEDRL